MRRKTQDNVWETEPVSLSMWLTFDPHTNEQYELENGPARAAHLRRTILIGLVLYNMYNFTGVLLMPDIVWQSVVSRVLVVTPLSIALAYYMLVAKPFAREIHITIGSINAYAVPVFLFWLSGHPWAAYSFGEFSITLVFVNMLLALRFRYAVLFTISAFSVTVFGLWSHPTLEPVLFQAFILQSFTACIFTLYGNYLIEKRRCTDYVIARTALMRASRAEQTEQQLTELSKTDALTGLPNRRYLDEMLDDWLDGSASVAVLMIDLDHFKLYNDNLGHPAGDDCLRQVAKVFQQEVQDDDSFCARFGGEEFTVLFHDINEVEASRRANRLVKLIEELKIAHPGRNDGIGVLTISVGLAMVPEGQRHSKDTALSNADTALYRAKRNGRNGCTNFTQIGGPRL